jgi:hypothetical protein
MDIEDRYIDVEFDAQPEFVFGDLGARCFDVGPFYEDVVPVIPRSEWPGLAEKCDAEKNGIEQLVTRIYDQKSEGSCVANACSQAHEIIQALQNGRENVVPLSAISLYKRIGRSPGSGAMVSDGLDEMMTRGILPLDTAENRAKFGDAVMPNTGFYTRYPAAWETVAALFKGFERFVIRSFDGLVTAGFNGHPAVVGRAGHSICYTRGTYKNNRLLMPYPNSWSLGWGQAFGQMTGGFGFDSESMISRSAGWAFALRAVV